jgi:hypothetical protein
MSPSEQRPLMLTGMCGVRVCANLRDHLTQGSGSDGSSLERGSHCPLPRDRHRLGPRGNACLSIKAALTHSGTLTLRKQDFSKSPRDRWEDKLGATPESLK